MYRSIVKRIPPRVKQKLQLNTESVFFGRHRGVCAASAGSAVYDGNLKFAAIKDTNSKNALDTGLVADIRPRPLLSLPIRDERNRTTGCTARLLDAKVGTRGDGGSGGRAKQLRHGGDGAYAYKDRLAGVAADGGGGTGANKCAWPGDSASRPGLARSAWGPGQERFLYRGGVRLLPTDQSAQEPDHCHSRAPGFRREHHGGPVRPGSFSNRFSTRYSPGNRDAWKLHRQRQRGIERRAGRRTTNLSARLPPD